MPSSVAPWLGLSADEHEFQYNPQKAFPDFARSRAEREPANSEALALPQRISDVAYGEHELRTLDIYPANPTNSAPVHIFFHGGYWRAQDKENFAYIGAMLMKRGVTAVIANYELCPGSTLDGVVDSALSALEWVYRNIGRYGGDAGSLTISGHSAGAHLVAEALAADWPSRDVEPGFIRRAIAVSGIFNPAPAALTSVNEQLNLTPDIIERHDLEKRAPRVVCEVSLFVGGREPWQWIDQTYRYAHHLHRSGMIAEVRVLPKYDHFDIMTPFMNPGSAIGRALLGRNLTT